MGSGAEPERERSQAALLDEAAEFHKVLTELVRVYMFRDRTRSGTHDVGVPGAHALDVLVREGSLGVNQLATELFIDKSTASRLVSMLEEKGYVTRTADPADRRYVQLEVTRAGRALHERICADHLQETAALLRPFAAEVRQGMMERLRQITCTYAVHAGITDASICLLSGGPGPPPFGAELRVAGAADLVQARALLESTGLPAARLDERLLGRLVVARDPEASAVLGVGGLESRESVGLVHSIAVHPSYRGAGLGRALLLAVVDLARIAGLAELYLEARIAPEPLRRLGWEDVAGGVLPQVLRGSEVLRSGTGRRSSLMRLVLRPRPDASPR